MHSLCAILALGPVAASFASWLAKSGSWSDFRRFVGRSSSPSTVALVVVMNASSVCALWSVRTSLFGATLRAVEEDAVAALAVELELVLVVRDWVRETEGDSAAGFAPGRRV